MSRWRNDRLLALASPVTVVTPGILPVSHDKPYERVVIPLAEVAEMWVMYRKPSQTRSNGLNQQALALCSPSHLRKS